MKELEDIVRVSSPLPLTKKTVLNILLTNVAIKETISKALKTFDISIEQFNVLRILRGKKGKATNLQDIQDRMISKMSNTTRLVDKLIVKDLAERFICEENRRKVDIFITDQGLQLLTEIDPIIECAEANMMASLSQDELKTLNTLLTKIRT